MGFLSTKIYNTVTQKPIKSTNTQTCCARHSSKKKCVCWI